MVKDTVILLAGGKSAEHFDLQNLKELGYVIGVNDAAIHAPVDCAITMDRTWFENRWQKIKDMGIPLYARWEATINVSDRWIGLNIFQNDRHSNEMSDNPLEVNGINSGFCGCNLAFKLKPKRFIAIGLDCANTGYWYPAYEWQTGPEPRGITSDWSYDQWQKGLIDIKSQFGKAGIEWI